MSLIALFWSLLALAETFPVLKDTTGRVIPQSFFERDHTLVLVVNRTNIDQVSDKIAKLRDEFSGRKSSTQKGLPLDSLQILLVYDGRADFQQKFISKAKKYDAPAGRVRPFKRIARGIGRNRVAPKDLAAGRTQMYREVTETMASETRGYISPDRYRTVALFGEPSDHLLTTGNKLRLKFSDNGPSMSTLRRLFGETSYDLKAQVLNPDGHVSHAWRGSEVDALTVAEKYYEEKIPESERRVSFAFNRQPSSDNSLEVFDRIKKVARENDAKYMVPTLDVLHNSTGRLSACSAKEDFASAPHLQSFLFEVFANVEKSINDLLDSYIWEQLRSRGPIVEYVKTASLLTRVYLQTQAKKFQGSETALAPAEQKLYDASYTIYKQVAELVGLESDVFAPEELKKEWGNVDLKQFRGLPKWTKIMSAIDKLQKEDKGDCSEFLAQQEEEGEPTPHAQLRRDRTVSGRPVSHQR